MGKCKCRSKCTICPAGPTGPASFVTGPTGPTGLVSDIISIGDGVPLFTGPTGGGVFEFRSLQDDCTTAVRQDIPIDGDILVTTNEYQTQLVGNGPNSDLTVYLSTTGNDDNDGSSGSPFLTLNRAFQEVRACGWDDTAAIVIDAAGGNYVIDEPELSLNAGVRGAQRTPLRLTGSGRTLIRSTTVATAAARPGSNLIELTGTIPFIAADVGRQIRFTSGPLSAITIPFLPGVTAEVDVAIAVFNAGTVIIPFNGNTLPNPGDSFVIEIFNTTIDWYGVSRFRSDANAIAFEDLNIIFHPRLTDPVPTAGFLVVNTEFASYGLRMTISEPLILTLINHDAGWISGIVHDDISNAFAPSTRSMFVDISSFFSADISIGIDNNPRLWGNTVWLGSGTGLLVFQTSGVLNDSYFSNWGTISPQFNGPLVMTNVEIQSSPGDSILVAEGSVTLSNIAILSPGADGVNANSSGRVTFGSIFGSSTLISGASSRAIYAHNGSEVYISGTPTIVGSTDEHILIESGALVTSTSALVLNGAGASGMVVRSGGRFISSFFGSSLTCNGNGALGLLVTSSGKVSIDTTLTATGNMTGGAGFFNANVAVLSSSFLFVGSTTTLTGALIGDNLLVQNSYVSLGNTDTSSSVFGNGINASDSTVLLNGFFSSPLASSSNAVNGVSLDRSTLSCDGGLPIVCSSNGVSGITAINFSSVKLINGLTAIGNIVNGITATNNTNVASGVLTITGNLVTGIVIDASVLTALDGGTIATNAVNGVSLTRGSRAVMVGQVINSNTVDGILVTSGSYASLTSISSGAANGTFGVEARHGSKVDVSGGGMSVTGVTADVRVGTNALGTTWALIATLVPLIVTDFFGATTEGVTVTA